MKKHKIWNIYTGFIRKKIALFCNRPLHFFGSPKKNCNFGQQNVYGVAIKKTKGFWCFHYVKKGSIALKQIYMYRVTSKYIRFGWPVWACLVPLWMKLNMISTSNAFISEKKNWRMEMFLTKPLFWKIQWQSGDVTVVSYIYTL